jgi:hypothetical protein
MTDIKRTAQEYAIVFCVGGVGGLIIGLPVAILLAQ